MRTVCKGWTADPPHVGERLLYDDRCEDGLLSDGICHDCVEVFRATDGLDEPAPCECGEHGVCDPPRAQTMRYLVEGGWRLCAQCTALGHMHHTSRLFTWARSRRPRDGRALR